jgi:hypothetical protein
MAFSSVFAQLQVLSQKQITRKKGDEFSVLKLGKKGFVLIQKTKSEEQRKFNTWSFTLYNLQLEEVWNKKTDVENDFIELAKEAYDGKICLILYNPCIGAYYSGEAKDLTLITINSESEISRKDIELSNKTRLYPGNFIGEAYYCHVADEKKDYDEIYKIDFASMSCSSNIFDLPYNTDVFERTTDGKKIYFRIKSTKKSLNFDALYIIENGAVIEKIPMRKQGNDEIDSLKIIMPDTAHRFVFGLNIHKVIGEREKDDLIDYEYSLSNMKEDDIQTINKVNHDISYQLYTTRDPSVTNKAIYDLFNNDVFFPVGNYTLISDCIRHNGKNFVVIDKCQSLWERHFRNVTHGSIIQQEFQSELIGYLFTNTVVWCFNDDGVVEWMQNFDYAIVSPKMKAITSAVPYDENRIAIIGLFGYDITCKKISMDGKVERNDEKLPLQYLSKFNNNKFDLLNNSLIRLFDHYYLVWGTDEELTTEAQTNSKKDLKLFFQIVELK